MGSDGNIPSLCTQILIATPPFPCTTILQPLPLFELNFFPQALIHSKSLPFITKMAFPPNYLYSQFMEALVALTNQTGLLDL